MSNPGQERIGVCSACCGDYEDPEAAAAYGERPASADHDDDDDADDASSEEFPARRERRLGSRARKGGPKRRSEEDRSMQRMNEVRSVKTSAPSQREVLRDVLLSATQC